MNSIKEKISFNSCGVCYPLSDVLSYQSINTILSNYLLAEHILIANNVWSDNIQITEQMQSTPYNKTCAISGQKTTLLRTKNQ